MTARTHRGSFLAAGILAVAAAWMPVVAQETADLDAAAVIAEDMSWKDKSVRQLRREYRDAEERFYDCLLYTSDAADDYFWV